MQVSNLKANKRKILFKKVQLINYITNWPLDPG